MGSMSTEQKDAIREANRRRAYDCPKCGHPARDLSPEESGRRRDDCLPGLPYRTCGGCGWTWVRRTSR